MGATAIRPAADKPVPAAPAPIYRPLAALCFVAAYAVLAAANGVTAAMLLQEIDIAAFTFVSFLCAALMFYAVRRYRERNGPSQVLALGLGKREIGALNITTGLSWILMYVAYANMEPAVAATLMCSVGPFVAITFEKAAAGPARPARARWALAGGFVAGGAVLFYGSLSGRSAVVGFDQSRILLGAAGAIGCGYFMTVSTVYLKRLSVRGFRTDQVMAHRFYLLLAVTGAYALWQQTLLETVLAHGALIAGLSVIGVVFPMVLLQRGITLGTPFLTMVVMAGAPLVSIVLQLFDGRLAVSPLSLIGVGMTFVVSIAAIRIVLAPASAPARAQ
jgi:drug/metabolite transporter (DMT)-like permease